MIWSSCCPNKMTDASSDPVTRLTNGDERNHPSPYRRGRWSGRRARHPSRPLGAARRGGSHTPLSAHASRTALRPGGPGPCARLNRARRDPHRDRAAVSLNRTKRSGGHRRAPSSDPDSGLGFAALELPGTAMHTITSITTSGRPRIPTRIHKTHAPESRLRSLAGVMVPFGATASPGPPRSCLYSSPLAPLERQPPSARCWSSPQPPSGRSSA